MRAFRLMAIGVAVLLLKLSPAAAQQVYIEGHGGLNIAFDSDIDDPFDFFEGITYDPGFAAGGAVGYQLNPNWRLEGEVTYRRNEADEFETAIGDFSAKGDVDSVAFMANGYYDFANSTAWTPYVGLGVGAAIVSWNDIEAAGGVLIDDSDTVFAFQFGGGVAFEFSPGTSLTFDYRLFGTTDATVTDEFGDDDDISYLNSSLWLGLRFAF